RGCNRFAGMLRQLRRNGDVLTEVPAQFALSSSTMSHELSPHTDGRIDFLDCSHAFRDASILSTLKESFARLIYLSARALATASRPRSAPDRLADFPLL